MTPTSRKRPAGISPAQKSPAISAPRDNLDDTTVRWRIGSAHLLVGLALLCGGCLSERSLAGVPQGPQSWRIGYAQGCASGRAAGRGYGIGEKDVARYRVNDLYRKGWNEGFGGCFEEAKEQAALEEREKGQRVTAGHEPVTGEVQPAVGPSPTVAVPPILPIPPEGARTAASPSRREVLIERIKHLEAELLDAKAQLKRLDQ